MEKKVIIASIDRVSRQRNLFMGLTLCLTGSLLLISIRLFSFDQKIVLVPGLVTEMSLSGSRVSSSYLEQMALIFLSQLLDISSGDIKHKRDLVLKYTSHSSAAYSREINEYFAKAEDEYQRFDLATHFTVKNMKLEPDTLQVLASGILTSWYGKKGYESTEVTYKINFEYNGGYLRLKEFGLVKEEESENAKKK
jgi:type IV conjugative transfer system protein TraE